MPANSMYRALVLVLLITASVSTRSASQAVGRSALETRLNSVLASGAASVIAIRHDIHQHPELSGAEVRTAALVADRLRALGFEVRTGVGGYGVVALLRGGRPGPVVAFRADMDAVPSSDPDPVDYRSLAPGIRHICGHDIHTAIGLSLAEAFAATKDDLPGSLLLVFQPAEERAIGARAMLADSAFSLARPVAIYAVHTAPMQIGRIGTEPGPLLAGRDRVEVMLTGTGNLDAAADSVVALMTGSGTISQAQAAGNVPHDFVLATVRAPRRVSADTRLIQATFSIADGAARTRTRRQIEAGVAALRVADVTPQLTYREREIAGVTNDAALTTRGEDRIRAIVRDASVIRTGVVSPLFSEDFGSFQQQVPGVMFLLGVSNAANGWVGMPHTAGYVADDAAIVLGARALAAVLIDRMLTGS